MKLLRPIVLSSILVSLLACTSNEDKQLALSDTISYDAPTIEKRHLGEEFKAYWYQGNAEITSYSLTQERYGELREGTSVSIFVTEDFLPEEQVKADRQSKSNIPVLKHNSTKKYLTGIYPYSIMGSAFSPVNSQDHAIKLSYSMQEWCGHVYVQLNNKKKFEIESHSYFEGEADQNISLEKTWQESELWNRVRINPEELPTGTFEILPSFEYFRMSHGKMSIESAEGNLVKGDSISTYTLTYPGIKRSLSIYFSSDFPHTIERWEETHANGLKTEAVKMKRLKAPYWGQNSNKHLWLRDSLGL